MAQEDYYGILGVPRTAKEADIKKAYRRLARAFRVCPHALRSIARRLVLLARAPGTILPGGVRSVERVMEPVRNNGPTGRCVSRPRAGLVAALGRSENCVPPAEVPGRSR